MTERWLCARHEQGIRFGGHLVGHSSWWDQSHSLLHSCCFNVRNIAEYKGGSTYPGWVKKQVSGCCVYHVLRFSLKSLSISLFYCRNLDPAFPSWAICPHHPHDLQKYNPLSGAQSSCSFIALGTAVSPLLLFSIIFWPVLLSSKLWTSQATQQGTYLLVTAALVTHPP